MPRNVLFILSDQHNAKVLGHKGHPDVRTPNLDRMAAEGVRFDNAVCQNPICTPSRMCFLSGQYAHNHGYYGLSGARPGDLPSFLGHFRDHGYRTAAIGKIHCPEYWIEDHCDIFHETCESSIEGRSQAYSDFLAEQGCAAAEDHQQLPEFGKKGRQSMDGRPSPLTFEQSQEGWIANQVIETIQGAVAENRGFCIHASLPRPHQCTTPCQEFWDLYEGRDLTLPPNADHDGEGKAPHLRKAAADWKRKDWAVFEPRGFDAARRRKLRGYLGAISQVDHAVGRMLDYLQEAGLKEDTLVLYSADHGEYACEHGIMEKAPGICADAVTRIPFLWWGGGVAAGYVAPELAESVDVANTCCAYAGLPALETADGKDLGHLLRGEAGAVHEVAVTEFAWSKSLRKGKYRLVYYPKKFFQKCFADEAPAGFGELYDLEADPWEMRNLYHDPAHQATVAELRADLLDWLVTTTRPANTLAVNSGGPGFCALSRPNPQRRIRNRCWTNADGKIHPDRIRDANWWMYI